MKKRILAILVTAAMMFSFAACTGEPGDETSTTTSGGAGESASKGDEEKDPDDNTGGEEVDPETQAKLDKVKKFQDSLGSPDGKTVINLYTFTDETSDMLAFMFEQDPTFTDKYYTNLVYNTDAGAHRTQVKNNIAKTGADSVDLFVADVDYAGEFKNLDGTATIDELGITITEGDYYKYTLDLAKKDGKLMGISHQATPGAMYYRADIAQDILGVESEDDMQKLVSDWDKFVETAQKIMDEKGDDFSILAGADELKRNFLNARTESWVVDNTFNIDTDTIEKFYDVTKKIADMGGLKTNSGGVQWTAGWNEGMKDGVFAYFGSTWYLHYTIKPGAKGGASDGKWGMIPGPQEFFWGGTYWFGSKTAAGDDDVKEGVKQIIEFFCVNDDSIKAYMTETGDFPSKKTVASQLSATDDQKKFFLFETDHYPVFSKIAENVDITKSISEYDDQMNEIFNTFINDLFGSNDFDDAIAKMKDNVKSKIPGLTVV